MYNNGFCYSDWLNWKENTGQFLKDQNTNLEHLNWNKNAFIDSKFYS